MYPQVHAAFLQLAEANVLRPYMRDALAEVSRAYTALKNNDAAPSSAGDHDLPFLHNQYIRTILAD